MNSFVVLIDAVIRREAVVFADHDGKIVAVTPSAAEMLGYQLAEMIGMEVVRIIPERYREQHLCKFALAVERKSRETKIFSVFARKRSGEEVEIDYMVQGFELNGQQYFAGILRAHANTA